MGFGRWQLPLLRRRLLRPRWVASYGVNRRWIGASAGHSKMSMAVMVEEMALVSWWGIRDRFKHRRR